MVPSLLYVSYSYSLTALWPNERRHGKWSGMQPKRPETEDIPSHPHDSSVMFSFIFVFNLYDGDIIDNIGLFNRVGLIEWIQNTKPFKELLQDAMTQTELGNYSGKYVICILPSLMIPNWLSLAAFYTWQPPLPIRLHFLCFQNLTFFFYWCLCVRTSRLFLMVIFWLLFTQRWST